MRVNEYNSLEEFIDEYASGKSFSWENEDRKERYMGLEFMYHGVCYRMCREPLDDEDLPDLKNGKKGRYATYIMHVFMTDYEDDDIIELDWYSDIYDVLENWIIDGLQFKEVIMADETVIWGKD